MSSTFGVRLPKEVCAAALVSPFLYAFRSVRRVVDSEVEHEAKAASSPSMVLVPVLSEFLTAAGIAH